MKFVLLGFLAVLASLTIIVVSSGLPNNLAYRNHSVIDLAKHEGKLDGKTPDMSNITIKARHLEALANGCSSVPTSDNWVVRCPFWVTP